jgi:predicted RecA/RadA family phage recombinase
MAQTVHAIWSHGLQQRIDWTPNADVPAGNFVFSTGYECLVGVATELLEANRPGAIEIMGIYKVKKKAGVVFAFGEPVEWDEGNHEAVKAGDAAADRQLGVCVAQNGAASGDDYVLTRINMARGYEASGD